MARRRKPKDELGPEDLGHNPFKSGAPDAAVDKVEADAAKEPAEKPSAPPPPDPDAPSPIPLKVFIKIAGPKWDQMAGFLSDAKLKNMGPRTVPEWRAAYQEFMRKPVK